MLRVLVQCLKCDHAEEKNVVKPFADTCGRCGAPVEQQALDPIEPDANAHVAVPWAAQPHRHAEVKGHRGVQG